MSTGHRRSASHAAVAAAFSSARHRSAERLAERRQPSALISASPGGRRSAAAFARELLVDDHVALDPRASCERILDAPFETTGPRARARGCAELPTCRWVDDAADDERRRASRRSAEASRSDPSLRTGDAALSSVSTSACDRLLRAAFDDRRRGRAISRASFFRLVEPVVIRLPGLGARRDRSARRFGSPTGRRRLSPIPPSHDRNRVARLHAKADGCHFISSLTSSNGSACVRERAVGAVAPSTRARCRAPAASAARIGPDPTLTRATPSASSSGIGGVPFDREDVDRAADAAHQRAEMVSRSRTPGTKTQSAPAARNAVPRSMATAEARFRRAERAQEDVGAAR